MLFKSALFCIAALGTTALAIPAAQPQALPPQAPTPVKRQFATTVVESNPTPTVAGTFAFKNFQTVNQYGMTTLSFAFSDAKNATRSGKCGITMIRRTDEDLCGYPGAWTISTLRNGDPTGDWPMNIQVYQTVYSNGGGGTYRANLTLAGPGDKKNPLSCKTSGGATTCTPSKALNVPYTFYPY